MDPARPLTLKAAAVALVAVVAVELAARPLLPISPGGRIAATGLLRALEALGLLVGVARCRGGLAAIGLGREDLVPGLRRGLIWSLAFAVAAGLGGAILWAGFSIDGIAQVRVRLPAAPIEAALYLLVAGLVSPVAEEILFRGVLFAALRRFGAPAAIAGSTLLFTVAHGGPDFPLVPLIGGLVFAWAMETERRLAAPVAIHVLGNLALFALSAL